MTAATLSPASAATVDEVRAVKGDTPGYWDRSARRFRPVTLAPGTCPSCWSNTSHTSGTTAAYHADWLALPWPKMLVVQAP